MRKRWLVGAAALAIGGTAVPAAADAPIAADAKVAPDPAVRLGTFANGLHYAVMPNRLPTGAVSIRLAFDVGSYLEGDDELGYAHFVEHMAFRSTRQAPTGVLDNRFGTLGVALGRDQNAATTLGSTVYSIDLPKNDPASIATVLDWMRGAADGINFTAETVGAERGAVLSELRERGGPMADFQKAIARFQFAGTRSGARDPGGTVASVGAATPERLKAFHDRWYRPENARLVIVGDVDADALIRMAEQAFGSWRADGPAPVRPAPKAPTGRGLGAIVLVDPTVPDAVSACRVTAPEDRAYSLARERRATYSMLWSEILGERLEHRSNEPKSPLAGAKMLVNRDIPDGVIACLVVVPTSDRWKDALALAEAELRRFAKDGPTEAETGQMVAKFRNRFNGAVYQSDSRDTKTLADTMTSLELGGTELSHPTENLRILDLVTDGTNAGDLKKAFEADWGGAGPLIAAMTSAPVAREALLAAWQDAEHAAPLAAFETRATAEWAYGDFGVPGNVKRKQNLKPYGVTRYTFANGTVLNFKPSTLESGGVEVRVRFGNGERGLEEKERVAGHLATGLVAEGGLGKMEYPDIEAALSGTTWQFKLAAATDAFTLSASTLSDQVYQELQVLAAYMTDPGFRPAMDDKLPTILDIVYRNVEADPGATAELTRDRTLFPNQPSLPPRETLDRLKAKDFERMLRAALTQMPAEVTIVGDTNEKYVRDAVAATFGALPPRAPRPEPTGAGPFRRFPDALPKEATGYHKGPAGKAAAILTWPLYVATPERRREEYALDLLGTIFQTRLMQVIRGEMGKVYSPTVETPMPDGADQGYLAARFETATADLEPVVAATRRIAADLVAGRVTAEELERARTPLIAAYRQRRDRNAPWASAIAIATRQPAAMRELTDYEAEMGAVTLDDVRAAAAAWLAREPMVARALPAPATASTPLASGAR